MTAYQDGTPHFVFRMRITISLLIAWLAVFFQLERALGQIFYADPEQTKIYEFDPTTAADITADFFKNDLGFSPGPIAVTKDLRLFVTNISSGLITEYKEDGTSTGNKISGLVNPQSLAVGGSFLYIAYGPSGGGVTIAKYSLANGGLSQVSVDLVGSISGFASLGASDNGEFYVASNNTSAGPNGTLQKYSTTGAAETSLGLTKPSVGPVAIYGPTVIVSSANTSIDWYDFASQTHLFGRANPSLGLTIKGLAVSGNSLFVGCYLGSGQGSLIHQLDAKTGNPKGAPGFPISNLYYVENIAAVPKAPIIVTPTLVPQKTPIHIPPTPISAATLEILRSVPPNPPTGKPWKVIVRLKNTGVAGLSGWLLATLDGTSEHLKGSAPVRSLSHGQSIDVTIPFGNRGGTEKLSVSFYETNNPPPPNAAAPPPPPLSTLRELASKSENLLQSAP